MELAQEICQLFQLPYVYFLMRSRLGRLEEIKAGLKLGVKDYLIFQHNPSQIRSWVLVGLKWLTCIVL